MAKTSVNTTVQHKDPKHKLTLAWHNNNHLLLLVLHNSVATYSNYQSVYLSKQATWAWGYPRSCIPSSFVAQSGLSIKIRGGSTGSLCSLIIADHVWCNTFQSTFHCSIKKPINIMLYDKFLTALSSQNKVSEQLIYFLVLSPVLFGC